MPLPSTGIKAFHGRCRRVSIAGMITFEAIEIFDGKKSVGWKILLHNGDGESRILRRPKPYETEQHARAEARRLTALARKPM
jgi:hypothetical protein